MACASNAVHSRQRGSAQNAQAWLLNNNTRLHLHHGPIDLIVDALGTDSEIQQAYRQATIAFQDVLDTLARQLPMLRTELTVSEPVTAHGDVAQRMINAAKPFYGFCVTPMIAVAGAVADHICSAMLHGRKLERVLVNNGGDIALHIASDSSCRVGIARHVHSTDHPDIITLEPRHGVAGIATSGWQGRSHSLGVADAVTVLAADSARADAAATLIANAVDIPGSLKIKRTPACELNPDSDLGRRMVTVEVDKFNDGERQSALSRGESLANRLVQQGMIKAAYLHLQGQSLVIGKICKQTNAAQQSSQLPGCGI